MCNIIKNYKISVKKKKLNTPNKENKLLANFSKLKLSTQPLLDCRFLEICGLTVEFKIVNIVHIGL